MFLNIHIQCPACAQDYPDLRGFEWERTKFRQPEKADLYPPHQPKHWPLLEASVQTLYQTSKLLSYSIAFKPVFRETNPNQPLTEYTDLFDDSLDETTSDSLSAAIIAWRSGLTTCDLQIELTNPLYKGRQSDQTILVTYDNRQSTLTTNSNGEAVLSGLEIEKLASLRLEIQIKP